LCRTRDNFYNKYKSEIDMIDKSLLRNGNHTTDEWYNAYFQIFSAIYVLQKKMKMFHSDLHWGNVLVTQSTHIGSDACGYWKYIIDGVTYYVPNMGYVFKVWDFGLARSDYYVPMDTWNSRLDPNKFQLMYEQEHDYEYDEIYRKAFGLDTIRISNIPKWCANNNDEKFYGQCPPEFVEKCFKHIQRIVQNKEDTRPHILLLKLFGIYRHDKIGVLISNDIAEKIIDFKRSRDIDKLDLSVGQMIAVPINKQSANISTYMLVEINCMLPNNPTEIQVLYDRIDNQYMAIGLDQIHVLNRRIRTKYEINKTRCIGVFDLDKPIQLITQSENESESNVLPTSHPMIQSLTDYVDNFKRMEYSRRFN